MMYTCETTHVNVHLWLKHAICACRPVISWDLCNKLPKIQVPLLNYLQDDPAWAERLDKMTHSDPFQPDPICDSGN